MGWEITSRFTISIDDGCRASFNIDARKYFTKEGFIAADVLYDKDLKNIGFRFSKESSPERSIVNFQSSARNRNMLIAAPVLEACGVKKKDIIKRTYFLFYDPEEDFWYFTPTCPIGE